MKKQISRSMISFHYKVIPVLILSFLFLSCTIHKEGKLINRTASQEISYNVPANESEIRELKYNSHPNKIGHKDLRINGQLFTKKLVDGNAQIRPCEGCAIILTTPNDGSVKVNMTTEKDGFFSFHGQSTIYSVFINNPGFNQIKIGNISFETEGITTFKIINAVGNRMDSFTVVKNGLDYTWTKNQ